MLKVTNILCAGCCVLAVGCSSLESERNDQPRLGYSKYKDELALQNIDSYDVGLALSGGGVRASLFAHGALKALYDAEKLNKIDVMSSVSGGGYTAYSLFTSDNHDELGGSLFSKNHIYEDTCRLLVTGNFVTLEKMAKAGLSLHPKKEAIKMYHQSIGRTYGVNDQGKDLIKLPDLVPVIKSNQTPFLIVNTTVSNPVPTGWSNGLFEFTPLWMGNDSYSYYRWEDNNRFEFRKAVAISGAAFAPLLKQTIDVTLPNYSPSTITLSDGGHSENLGAIALVKRGVKNIIIVDAEHDPSYSFGAYKNLKTRLQKFDSNFSIDTIEKSLKSGNRLSKGFHTGKVTTQFKEGEVTSNIFYIKMSMPKSLDTLLANQESISRGKQFHNKYIESLKASNKGGNWQCSDFKHNEISKKTILDWYSYNIASYSKYLNDEGIDEEETLRTDFFADKFPQYTTADQSFYIDQSLAFIGLGYVEMTEAINDKSHNSLSNALK